MKIATRTRLSLPSITIGLILGCLGTTGVLWAALSQSARAQPPEYTTNADPLRDLRSSGDATNSPYENGEGMFDILHRAQQNPGRSLSEFYQDQQESMGSAVDEFRKQQELLLNQSTQPGVTQPSNPAVPSSQGGPSISGN
jgi:hypothetical protein